MSESLVRTVLSTAYVTSPATLTWAVATISGDFLAITTNSDVSGLVAFDNTQSGTGVNHWTKIAESGNATSAFCCLYFRANAPSTTSVKMTSGDLCLGAAAEYSGVSTGATTANASGSGVLSTAGTSETCTTSTGSGNASDLVLLALADIEFYATVSGLGTGYVVDAQVVSSSGATCILASNKGSAATGTESTAITGSQSQRWPYVIASFSAAGGAAFPLPAGCIVRQSVNRASTY